MFGFIKEKLKKVYNQVTNNLSQLFSKNTVDQEFLDELTTLLIAADTGIETTNTIITTIKNKIQLEPKEITPLQIKEILHNELLSLLQTKSGEESIPSTIMLVGINGSGKTTFAGKLAHNLKQQGKKVLLVAADTFRAAAVKQLQEWGNKIDVTVCLGKTNQDPASVIFDACRQYKENNYDHLIIDTAGRLQTKTNLMNELSKMNRILKKQLPNETIHTWLTIDAMLGQNSFQQAKIFHEATTLHGIILTKLDGTGKGGIVFSITKELHLPIIYVTFGEGIDAIKLFNAKEYVDNLLET